MADMRDKAGHTIRTRVAWSGIPKGTEGLVKEFDGRLLAIVWRLPGRAKPLAEGALR